MNTDPNLLIHPSPFTDRYATQDISTSGVWLCDKTSDHKVLVQPPVDWGRHWSWNITLDGKGINIKRIDEPRT